MNQSLTPYHRHPQTFGSLFHTNAKKNVILQAAVEKILSNVQLYAVFAMDKRAKMHCNFCIALRMMFECCRWMKLKKSISKAKHQYQHSGHFKRCKQIHRYRANINIYFHVHSNSLSSHVHWFLITSSLIIILFYILLYL